MNQSKPPPLATAPHRKRLRGRFLIWGAAALSLILMSLRPLGLIRPFKVPTGAMMPAISAGDPFMMEAFTLLARRPKRGDIIVFDTGGLDSVPQDTVYIKRVVGEPRERLRISDGKLYVNDKHVPVKNRSGEIAYVFLPSSVYLRSSNDTATVPKGCYLS